MEWVAISSSNAWKWKVKVKSLSRVWLLATPWTAAYQAPPSMGFSRQEYWSGVPLPSPFLSLAYINLFSIKTSKYLAFNTYLMVVWMYFLSWINCFYSFIFLQLYNSEKAMAPHSSTLAWKTPWTQEPGRLQSMGSRRVRHDWVTSLSLFTFMHWRRKWQPTLAWRIPGTGEPGGLPSLGSHRVGHNWSDLAAAAAAM